VDPLEDLLYVALEAFESDGAGGLQRFYAAHPEEAPELRARFTALREAGLLDDAQRMRTGLPETIDEFRVLGSLGEGGMGVVYLAEQPSLGRRVALKLVRPEHLLFPGARERFQREVAIVARLAHPGVAPIYSVGEVDGVPYFAMEAVDGATLAEVLKELAGRQPASLTGVDLLAAVRACRAKRGATASSSGSTELFSGSWAQVATRIAMRIAEALAHAHERGVLHRDIKPANVMLTEDGRVLLLDFGLASLQGTSRLTRTGSLLGSIPYMAPEQLRGDGCDARSDVWSVGVTFYELLTLRLPFSGRNDVEVRLAIERADPRPPRATHEGLTWEVETVCLAALEREPTRRYATAAALAEDLRAILELRPISARRPGPWQLIRRAFRRHPVRAALGLFGLVTFSAGPLTYGVIEHRARVRIEAANAATEHANTELAEALELVTTERNRADEQRARAEARFDDALAAVDTMLRRTAESRLVAVRGTAKLRQSLLEDALQFHTRLAESTQDDPRAREERARSLVRAAGLRFDLGQLQQAVEATEDAVHELQALTSASQRPALLRRELARALELRGKALAKLGRSEDSQRSFESALEVLGALAAEFPDDTRLRADLAMCEISHAHGLADRGQAHAARAALERLRARLEAPESADLPELWLLRGGVEEGLAVLAVQSGEFGVAEATYTRAQAVLRDAAVVEGDDPRHRAMLAGVLEQRAELAHQQRNWGEAQRRIGEALEVLTLFAEEERDVPMWPSRLASLLGTSADIRAKLGDAEGALADHDRGIALLESLVDRYPDDASHLQRLGIGYAQRASALEASERSVQARADMERAVTRLQQVVAARPTDEQAHANLAAALGNSAELTLQAGDVEGAWVMLERALELARRAGARGGPGPRIELLSLAGKVAAMRGDLAAADTAMQEGVEVAEAWWQRERDDPGRAFNVAYVALNSASYYIDSVRSTEARALLEKALSAARFAIDGGPTMTRQVLAVVHLELAHLDDLAGDEASAREHVTAARAEAGLTEENQAQWLGSYRRLRELYARLR
jgi:serine/threonine protein kinase/tetratricopeptide (TPR) repeat protein